MSAEGTEAFYKTESVKGKEWSKTGVSSTNSLIPGHSLPTVTLCNYCCLGLFLK